MFYQRPEHAAAAIMRAEGWTCATCEGGPMLLLMKAAFLERLMELNALGAAGAARSSNTRKNPKMRRTTF